MNELITLSKDSPEWSVSGKTPWRISKRLLISPRVYRLLIAGRWVGRAW